MTIEFVRGNLLDANVEAFVNPVNCAGVMGKGVALLFKNRFPANFKAYAEACKTDKVRLGHMFICADVDLNQQKRIIINFPTKASWRDASRLSWIEEGLRALVIKIKDQNIRSIAVPALGCGAGGLDWQRVKPVMETHLGSLKRVTVLIYEPLDGE